MLGRRPDRICDGNLPRSQRNAGRWFDYTCFVTHQSSFIPDPNNPARTIETNYQGNAGTNIITGPGVNNVDLGIYKNFRLTERFGLQFRFEAFNAFNHPNLLGPASYNRFTNNSTAAQITRQLDNRDIQLALKFLF